MLSGLMNMEGIGTEEHVAVGSCNNNNSHVIKGKRTKRRLKPLSPCVFTATSTAVTSSCSSASCGGDGGSFSSTTFEGTDQEEKDMANCLILLAQGKREREEEEGVRDRDPNHHHHQLQPQQQQYKLQKAENHVMVTKSGLDNYECKTCNRTFPSFQALGGHRASHKKPKMQVEKKSSPPPPPLPITATTGTATATREFEESIYDFKQSHMMMMKNIITNAPPVSLELRCGVVNNNKPIKPNKPNKIHECSICGSEFTSGQALGGHMRRHRAATSSNNNNNVDAVTTLSVFNDVNVKSRNVLELDLNLPAPEDDAFQFPATRKSVVLSSAPALVGCHY